MASNRLNFGRRKTLGIEPKNEEKVFIKIPLENGKFWEREYLQNDLIANVINDFKKENHIDIPKDYFMDWNCKNKSLKMTDKIKSLLVREIPTICFNAEMKKKPLNIQEEDIIPQIVGKPFNNPFEIFLFRKKNKNLKIQTYDENLIQNLGLNNYGSSSAYCNGDNKLFISGGETKDGEIIENFWNIDLENNNFINEPTIIPPKKNHSMIYIPPRYVFIVGGNDKRTFYFDNEKQEINDWAELNIERIEPALQRVGKVLYCFDNVFKANNDKLSFEKTELNSKNPKWVLFYPKFDPSLSIEKFPQKFFGTAKDIDNTIIFLGGNMDYYSDGNRLNNYRYNPHTNIIEISNVPYKDYNFKEKTFLPYNKNIDYILPDFNKQHPEVVFYVKNKSKLEKVGYKPNLDLNKKNILRGVKRSLFDSKYDFNMPTIKIPDLPSGNFNENLNINKNIKLKAEPKEYVSPYASKDINEPSFQEYDFNLNYKIEQPPPFKEPEIEVNKGDQRLSIEIPNNIIESSREKENEKKEIDLSINIREEEKDENKNKAGRIKLKYAPRPPLPNYNRPIFTKMPNYENELMIIPKFHSSVNDPGNELNITRKGKIYMSYIPREPIRIKSSYADFNIKSSRLAKDDLILPNYNYSVNYAMNEGFGDISPGNNGMSARNIKYNLNMDGDIFTPSIHLPKSENINLNEIKLNTPNYKFSGNIPGNNSPSGKINIKEEKLPDFELQGIIPGTPKINIDNSKINLKGPKLNTDYSLTGRIPSANLKGSNINLKGHNMNGIIYNLSGIIQGNPKIDLKVPNINVETPNIDNPKINLESSTKDLRGPNIDLKGPNLNLKEPNINFEGLNMDLKGSKLDPNINLEGPNLYEHAFNLNGKIPGVEMNRPKIGLKGSDYNLKGSIPGININSPKLEKPSGDIHLKGSPKIDIPKPNLNIQGSKINTPNYNLYGIIPGMKKSSSNIDIKGSRKIPNYSFNANIPEVNLKSSRIHMHSPDINIKGSRRIADYGINGKTNMSGIIPGINLKGSNLNLPSADVNLKGSGLESPNYDLSGNISGMRINSPNKNVKGSKNDGADSNLKGDVPEMKINIPKVDIKLSNIGMNSPKINLNPPKIDLKSPKIDEPDFNLKGNIPGMKINVPKIDMKWPTIDEKRQDYHLEGDIPGININPPKLDMPSGNINLKGPNLKSPNLNIKGTSDYNLSGTIPGANIKGTEIDINSPKLDLKGVQKDFTLNGIIPGSKSYTQKLNLEGPNINLKSPNINGQHFNLKGEIPGANINSPNLNIGGKLKSSNIEIPSPDINLKGTRNIPEYKIEGTILGMKMDDPNVGLKSPKINLNPPKIDLKSPKIEETDFNLKGNIPGMKINVPKVDIKSPTIDVKRPDYHLEGDIPGINLDPPKLDTPSGNIKLKGPNLKSPNLNIKGSSDYNLSGTIPGANIKGEKLDIPSGNLNLRSPNFNDSYNYKLNGNIPGKDSNDKEYILSGIIPSYRKNPNIEIKNYKMTAPDINFSTIDQNINIKNLYNNNIKSSFNTKGISSGKKNFHGSVNDPNYLDYSDIKGSRRALISSHLDIDGEIPLKINKNKINIVGNKIIEEKDVILQDPYNIDYYLALQQQNKRPQNNRKNINLVVSQLQIQPEQNNNKVNMPQTNFNIKPPEMDMEKNIDFKIRDINIDLNNNIRNLGNIDLKVDNEIGNFGNIDLKMKEKDKNINIEIPKVEIKNDFEIQKELPNIDIEKPKLKGKINLTKKTPTNLRFKPIKDDEDDNKFGINVNLNMNNIDEDSQDSKDSQNSSKKNNEGNKSKTINSEKSVKKRKGKGLPQVGIKTSNFKSSKIDVAGKLDVNNIDINNLKSANIGVNGVKLGERIIE